MTTVTEIKQYTADKLSSGKAEDLAKSLTDEPAVLAVEFVKALTKAKVRDAKLGEQGRTISTHEATIEELRGKLSEVDGLLSEERLTSERLRASLDNAGKLLAAEQAKTLELQRQGQKQRSALAAAIEKQAASSDSLAEAARTFGE